MQKPMFALGIALLAACGDPTAPPRTPSLVVFPDPLVLSQFETQQLAPALLDTLGNPITGIAFAFTSDDEAIAVVSDDGLVSSVGPAGETVVTVGGGGLTRDVPVVVTPTPSSFAVTPFPIRVGAGKSLQVTVAVLDATGDTIPDAEVTFATLDPAVATVSPTGQVQGLVQGSTQLVVASGSLSTGVPVTVLDPAIVASTVVAGRVFGVAIAPSGAGYVLYQDINAMVRITLPAAGVVTTVSIGTGPTAAAFHPDGATAYVTNQFGGTVSVVNVAANMETGTIAVGSFPFVLGVTPDGSELWVTRAGGRVMVADLPTGAIVDSVSVGAVPNGIAFHPSEPMVYVSSAGTGEVAEISTTTKAVLRTFDVGGTPQGLAVAPDGSELYIANEASGLQVWDLDTGMSITTINLGGGAFGLALSPDGAVLAATQPPMGQVQLVNRGTRTISKTVITMGTPRRVAFAPDGSVLVVPNEGHWFDIIEN
jgi:YVTN family beta-propeller protein